MSDEQETPAAQAATPTQVPALEPTALEPTEPTAPPRLPIFGGKAAFGLAAFGAVLAAMAFAGIGYWPLTFVAWVPMILECLNPLLDGWRKFRRDTNRAAAVAFISHWAFTHAPGDHKYLLSGAVASRPAGPACRDKNRAPLILYAGAHSRAGGIDRLVAALPRLKTAGARLVITGQGKGLDPDITRACETTPGVEDLGMVPEARLAELGSAADVLVNPRPIDFEDNRTNFPSKILDYLSYKRPIVSTRTDGVGPGYDELVRFTASDDPSDIATAIDDVLRMDDLARNEWMQRIAAAVDQMTPRRAAADFIEWLHCISIVPHSGTAT